MKHYILFTEQELDDMLHGEEIMHRPGLTKGEPLYFMCKEHFVAKEKEDIHTMQKGKTLPASYKPEPIIFAMLSDAKSALNQMSRMLDIYGVVTVGFLLEDVGMYSEDRDDKYGWTSLNGFKITENNIGYELTIPRAFLLDLEEN